MSFAASACADDGKGAAPSSPCTLPAQIPTPGGIPRDLPIPSDVMLTSAQVKKKFIAIEGFSERSIEELFKVIQPDLIEKNFDIINTDYEGFEAEIYIAKGESLAGIVAMREGPCDGYVKVNVLYDPLETPAGRKAVRKTRRLSGES